MINIDHCSTTSAIARLEAFFLVQLKASVQAQIERRGYWLLTAQHASSLWEPARFESDIEARFQIAPVQLAWSGASLAAELRCLLVGHFGAAFTRAGMDRGFTARLDPFDHRAVSFLTEGDLGRLREASWHGRVDASAPLSPTAASLRDLTAMNVNGNEHVRPSHA